MAKAFVLYRLPYEKDIHLIESKPKESYNVNFIKSLNKEHFIISPFQVDSKNTVYAFPTNEKRTLLQKDIMELDFSEKNIKGIIPTDSDLHQTKAGILRCKMKNGTYRKVVLSRVKKIKRGNKNLTDIFLELCKKYETAFVYLFQLPNGQTWCGATPETLAHYEAGQFKTMALAGTQSLGEKKPEDLVWEEKELAEQKWVQEHIEGIFESNSISFSKSKTFTTQAAHLAHIRTDFEAKCDPDIASQLLIDLHPTPAVCGTPTQDAKKEILKTEAHHRMYYSGFLGLYAPQKFNVFVNLRCMLVDADSFYLFVGGGLTKDSDPKLEWEETENKAGVLERVIL